MKRMILILVVASMLLTACGGEVTTGLTPTAPAVSEDTGEQAVAVGDQVTIRFAVDDWERSRYDGLIKAFEEDNPSIRIKLVSIDEILGLGPVGGNWPDDAWVRLASAADVIDMFPGIWDVVEQGLVRDLKPFVEADASFHPDDFYPGTLSQYQWQGGTWGIPTAVDFVLIFYDKAAFDKAGVSYPEPGWTWDDFLAKARTLTIRDGDKVTQWGFVQPWPNHLQFIESRVSALIDDSTEPPTPRFDQPDMIEAVRWYTGLYLDYKVTPYFEPPSSEGGGSVTPDGYALIEAGQAAMWHDFSVAWQWLHQQNPKMGVVPYPVDRPDSHTTLASIKGQAISAGTSSPDAAWRWINFLSRQLPKDSEAVQTLPARRSVAESSSFWGKIDEEFAAALRYAIDHSYVGSYHPGYRAFSIAIESILKGEKSVGDAMTEAQTQARAEIQEALAAQERATPVPTFVVADPGEETPGEDAVTINFTTDVAHTDLQPYRDLAKRFHETHSDIVVEVNRPDYASGSIDMPDIAADADCFQWYPSLQDPNNLAAILSLEPFLDADPSFSTDDFYPALLAQFTAQGQLWGLPADAGPYVVEYNKDLFDAAGVEYPQPDWTMDDFLALAVALTKGEGESKQYGFVGDSSESATLRLMIERLGAWLIDESVDPPTVAFDDPATIKAVRWYADLDTKYGVKPLFYTYTADFQARSSAFTEREALINDGRAATWIKTGGMVDFRGNLNIGVVPLPAAVDGSRPRGYLATTGYFISAQTQARTACWQWIAFLTGQPNVVQGLPARRSIAESDAYRQLVGAERAAAYLASSDDVDSPSSSAVGNSWLGVSLIWLTRAYDHVVKGEASVEEALAAAQDLFDDYRTCVIARNALSDPDTQQACQKEVDPTLPDFATGGD